LQSSGAALGYVESKTVVFAVRVLLVSFEKALHQRRDPPLVQS
jgi:hypothetical protein